MKTQIFFLFCLFLIKSETGATQAQSTIVANKIVLSGTSFTSVVKDTISTPGNTSIPTTLAVANYVRSWLDTTFKRVESYSGTTNSNGVCTITFSQAFSVAPNIQASIPNQSATDQFIRVTSVSTTGCVINVFARATLSVLGIDLLASATTNVNGANVDIIALEK